MFIDLHTHTTASDGTLTPNELLSEAKKKEIEVVSITDHDTIEGLKGIRLNDKSVFFIPGIEISAEFNSTLHILGYAFDIENKKLSQTLAKLQRYRQERNYRIIEKMSKMGFEVTIDELKEIAKGEVIGRPHFARAMVNKGYVSSIQEAFDLYLKRGSPLYEEKVRLEPKAAVELIQDAGGIPVLAHPYQTKLEDEKLEVLVKELTSYGLKGIEAFYSLHTPLQVNQYIELSRKYDLLVTAGSDFHGENKPIPLGINVDYFWVQKFLCETLDRLERRKKNEKG